MIGGKVARRYAKALFELADEAGKIDSVGEQLASLKALISGSDELGALFSNPVISPQQKRAVFEELAQGLGVERLVANTVRLLIRKDRIQYLEAVVAEYLSEVRERKGILLAELASAGELPPNAREAVRGKLEEIEGKTIELATAEEPELIGGLVVRLGGTVYDGSVAAQLRLLQRRLVED